jgi:hypothetical protein
LVSFGPRSIVQAFSAVLAIAVLASAASAQDLASSPSELKRCVHPQVLIAGGTLQPDGTAALPSAELYDVATGTFSSASAMILSRTGHTATMLRDGRVLIAGGEGPDYVITATAEIYDPATGKFISTGTMNSRRIGHSATLLRDGAVLIAGGNINGNTVTGSAEIYDPKTGSFKLTGPMAVARENQGASLLREGTVLIAGGDNGLTELQSAELYRPESHRFVSIHKEMVAPGSEPATVLRNGTVLMVGESDPTGCCPKGADKGAEIYHPLLRTFRKTTGDTQEIRTLPSATLLNDGTVLLAGGYPLEAELDDAETYDPATETFTLTDNLMSSERGGHTATLLPDGTVLVAGGLAAGMQPGQIRDEFPQASADLYDPVTRLFAPTGAMMVPRAGHTANLVCAP